MRAADFSPRTVETWAAEHDCALVRPREAAGAALTGHVAVSSEFPLPERLPPGLFPAGAGRAGIYIGIHTARPYDVTLRLIPRIVCLGVGCRRGVSAGDVERAVRQALDGAGVDIRAVREIATIDVKRDEAGLLAFAEALRVPVRFYSARELAGAAGEFPESDFVRKTVGVGNVCQRAAALGGRVILPKTALGGVTVAASVCRWELEL